MTVSDGVAVPRLVIVVTLLSTASAGCFGNSSYDHSSVWVDPGIYTTMLQAHGDYRHSIERSRARLPVPSLEAGQGWDEPDLHLIMRDGFELGAYETGRDQHPEYRIHHSFAADPRTPEGAGERQRFVAFASQVLEEDSGRIETLWAEYLQSFDATDREFVPGYVVLDEVNIDPAALAGPCNDRQLASSYNPYKDRTEPADAPPFIVQGMRCQIGNLTLWFKPPIAKMQTGGRFSEFTLASSPNDRVTFSHSGREPADDSTMRDSLARFMRDLGRAVPGNVTFMHMRSD